MQLEKLFHISENPEIKLFQPRPSPTSYEQIKGDVVFAVNNKFLHNYFFPRDCPRIAIYRNDNSSENEIQNFFGHSIAEYILTTESSWYNTIKKTTLYCYEFSSETFTLLDEGAGYYISSETIEPLSVNKIDDIILELLILNIELRFTPNLWKLADSLKNSTLNFSMIRMRNALPRIP